MEGKIEIREGGVFRGKEEIQLTPTEFKLLRCLMDSPGAVQTIEYLIEKCWGAGRVGESNLRFYVNYLRKKIGDDPSRPIIVLNKHGVGYHINSEYCAVQLSPFVVELNHHRRYWLGFVTTVCFMKAATFEAVEKELNNWKHENCTFAPWSRGCVDNLGRHTWQIIPIKDLRMVSLE